MEKIQYVEINNYLFTLSVIEYFLNKKLIPQCGMSRGVGIAEIYAFMQMVIPPAGSSGMKAACMLERTNGYLFGECPSVGRECGNMKKG